MAAKPRKLRVTFDVPDIRQLPKVRADPLYYDWLSKVDRLALSRSGVGSPVHDFRFERRLRRWFDARWDPTEAVRRWQKALPMEKGGPTHKRVVEFVDTERNPGIPGQFAGGLAAGAGFGAGYFAADSLMRKFKDRGRPADKEGAEAEEETGETTAGAALEADEPFIGRVRNPVRNPVTCPHCGARIGRMEANPGYCGGCGSLVRVNNPRQSKSSGDLVLRKAEVAKLRKLLEGVNLTGSGLEPLFAQIPQSRFTWRSVMRFLESERFFIVHRGGDKALADRITKARKLLMDAADRQGVLKEGTIGSFLLDSPPTNPRGQRRGAR